MRKEALLLHAYDRLSKEFRSACDKVREKASDRPIHQLRVTARRWTAVLDLIPPLTKHKSSQKVHRRLQKVLKRTSPLRDIQVQLEKVSNLDKVDLRQFSRDLERRRKNEVADIQRYLKRVEKSRFTQHVETAREHCKKVYGSLEPKELQNQIRSTLQSRSAKFQRAQKSFRPANEDALHDMRIALKKLRYATEAAQPVLDKAVIPHAPNMKWFQQLVGDARDVFILEAELEKWAARKGKRKAIGKVLEQLTREREALLAKITAIRPALANISAPARQARRSEPRSNAPLTIGEKTIMIGTPVTAAPINELAMKQTAK